MFSNKEQQESYKSLNSIDLLNDLVRLAMRLFYEDKFIIVMDLFIREQVLKLNTKDVNKLLAKLKEDRMIRSDVRYEKGNANQDMATSKLYTRSFFYIEYKQLVDVIKFKVYRISKQFETMIRSGSEHKGYFCSGCNRVYSSLEVQSMLNTSTFLFHCDVCNSELIEYTDEKMKNGPQEALSKFMEQTFSLISLLKKTESIAIPHFDFTSWLEQNPRAPSIVIPPISEVGRADVTQAASHSSAANLMDGAFDAKSDIRRINADNMNEDSFVSVDIVDNLAMSAEPKRVYSSTVPVWHSHSTVTGEQISTGRLAEALTAQSSSVGNVASYLLKSAQMTSKETLAPAESKLADGVVQMKYSDDPIELTNDGLFERHMEAAPEEPAALEAVDDPFVFVNGTSKPFSLITDDDKSVMSPEEYADYYQIFMERQ